MIKIAKKRYKKKSMAKKVMDKVAMVLSAVGGLNWGVLGLGDLVFKKNWNLVDLALGKFPVAENIVYILVGVSAGYLVFKAFKK